MFVLVWLGQLNLFSLLPLMLMRKMMKMKTLGSLLGKLRLLSRILLCQVMKALKVVSSELVLLLLVNPHARVPKLVRPPRNLFFLGLRKLIVELMVLVVTIVLLLARL
jgi:hypothetical protein